MRRARGKVVAVSTAALAEEDFYRLCLDEAAASPALASPRAEVTDRLARNPSRIPQRRAESGRIFATARHHPAVETGPPLASSPEIRPCTLERGEDPEFLP